MSRRSNTAVSRLQQDYLRIRKDPVPYIVAEPLPSNLLEWHYVVTGPEGSLYEGGFYHGKLVFPSEFPFKPPAIYMITPNGRFKTDTRLCLSISDYHPDTWNPAWCVATILTGLLSFMLEKSPTLGSIESTESHKKLLAVRSHSHNLQNRTFCELFPDKVKESKKFIAIKEEEERLKVQNVPPTADQRNEMNSQNVLDFGLYGAITNILFLGGFALFALIVQYVIQSIASDSD